MEEDKAAKKLTQQNNKQRKEQKKLEEEQMRVAQMARAIGRGLFQSFADTAPEIRAIMISAAQMQSVPGAVPDETLASPRCAAEPLPEAVLNEVTASQVSGGPSPKSTCKCDACGRYFKSKRKAPDMDKSITSGGKPSKPKTTHRQN